MNQQKSPLRLRKKHGDGRRRDVTVDDGARLVRAQSLRDALVAGLIAIVVFCALWVAVTALFDRVFPWATVVLGYLIGHGVRIAGRGVDWRFPLLAAVLALFGSLVANVVLAASVTAEAHGTGMLQILRAVTSTTWPVFFDEVLTAADAFYAALAMALAAFFAPRKLTREEYFGLRLWREERSHD